ncbi:hypothetical protein C7Y66_11005 [Chroococcidiopsis sp. CCALA 051]|uniref:hypothetical protein n=1 Tax=Chroococcidiopsis sp. CCALA 051 TaxID=869949 RepID=UPI000D0CC38B|nr:hypothetical protein [Chroococcidiopsis sp. CCALA 051]MBE9018895.1 hypothetical protein [Chroococcidiopsidales cyanobacterium LEGE 13417]PSM49142.1 hypothetical protein C7Y66_11005 [Chroococcidiopsis sp. CCALA 051]
MSKPTHYPLTMDEFLKLNTLLTDAELRVYLYLMIKNPFPDSRIEIDTAFISEQLGLTRRTVQRSVKKIAELKFFPNLFFCNQSNSVEYQIRDRLHAELGGLVEVITPAGRIDLLTDTEIIEVKAVKDWKAALGQILVYSGFYPQHQKRLHLFGTASALLALADIEVAVLGFAVKVTGEEVKK